MEYNENVNVEETTTEETSPAEPTEEETEADTLIELYEDDESEETDDSEGLGAGTKFALAGCALALAGGGIFAGIKHLKNRKALKAQSEVVPGKEVGPKPIPDTQPTAKAIRGRKITMRERLTGHLYLDPEEVKQMQELQASNTQEDEEEES